MNITIINKRNGSALIEWNDEEGKHRGSIPEVLIENNQVEDDYLSMAIPYGIDWEFVLEDSYRTVTASDLAQSLRNHNIWTAEDARRNPGAVQGAILSAYGMTFQTILKAAKDFISNGGSANG